MDNERVIERAERVNSSLNLRCVTAAGRRERRRRSDTDPDLSQKQRASLVAVAGAVIGAILALFLITVFIVVTLMACRSQPPTYSDKVIDLPPTHKPPPPYAERPPAVPLPVNHTQVMHQVPQVHWVDRRGELPVRAPVRGAPHRDPRNHAREPLPYQGWICHHKGADRVYINHREHYV
ncbi:hypothetical protein SKAU_G00322970 [Synaphobranchus kaupii]|uniref:Uncharacterized protein n=1 Tax=Synaphobranchus kaupii TaxID=118154 RepID=A0A9Q1EP56_SYNKA|nr:hypothetical protein SKAU_G00322970 [Synaphobranchus kaupii]